MPFYFQDFALDPEEGRIRAAAHHMARNMTAGMALITCREPLIMNISNNLKNAFTKAVGVSIMGNTKGWYEAVGVSTIGQYYGVV